MTSPLSPPSPVPCAPRRSGCRRLGGPALRALLLLGSCGALSWAGVANADPLPSPSFSGPLAPNPHPFTVDAGPFGSVAVSGQVSGIGVLQTHASHAGGIGNQDGFVDLSNGQIEIQTTQGPLQFYVQAGEQDHAV